MIDKDSPALLRLARDITSLTTQIQEHLQKTSQPELNFTPQSNEIAADAKFEALKTSLSEAAQDLQLLVNGPKTTLRALYGTHYDLAAHQVALEFDLFGLIPLDGTIHVQELAEVAKLDVEIVKRVLRLLITQRVFRESPQNEYSHSALSALIANDDDLKASFHMQMDEVFQAASETASFLRQSTSPLAVDNCPFSKRFTVPIFKYYEQNPSKGGRFGKAMAGATKLDRNVNALRDLYNWGKLGKGLIVDVGGADGSVSLLLAKEWPDLSFIVQDSSPALLSQGSSQIPAEYASRFTFQAYDFFTPQTVINADLFFIRQCLHNWPDAECVKILRGFVPALEKCSSGTPILINESILPNSSAISRSEKRLMRQVDMSMLINVGARQRTEDDFRRIVKEADSRLDIVKVHNVGSMGLIEVRLTG